jgi:hypothetical protein
MKQARRAVMAGWFAATAFAAAPVWGGISDTPLPQFTDGKPSVRIMAVPGVIKRARLQTDFLCTSLDSVPVDIGVEVFDPAGVRLNDVGAGAGAVLDVGPGQTVTIGTSSTAAFLESLVLAIPGVAPGSARVVASSERVRCNALIVDNAVSPPVSMGTLGEGVRPAAGAAPASVPLPQFSDGQVATHSALIPGAVKRARMQTDIFCTSLAATDIDIGIQVFGPDGTLQNDVSQGNGALVGVAPGVTVSIGTTGTAAFLETQVIMMGGVAQGAARLVSTSPDVACTAFVVDSGAAPPAAMSALIAGPGAPIP